MCSHSVYSFHFEHFILLFLFIIFNLELNMYSFLQNLIIGILYIKICKIPSKEFKFFKKIENNNLLFLYFFLFFILNIFKFKSKKLKVDNIRNIIKVRNYIFILLFIYLKYDKLEDKIIVFMILKQNFNVFMIPLLRFISFNFNIPDLNLNRFSNFYENGNFIKLYFNLIVYFCGDSLICNLLFGNNIKHKQLYRKVLMLSVAICIICGIFMKTNVLFFSYFGSRMFIYSYLTLLDSIVFI